MELDAKDLLEEVFDEDKILELSNLGYFTAPASSKYHLAEEGGLAKHSANVTNTMLKINEGLDLGLKRKDIIIAGMLHDLIKVSYYKKNILKSGLISDVNPYKYAPVFDIGHGSGSLYLIINDLDIKIPVYVATAIRYHGGFNTNSDYDASKIIRKNPIDMIMTWLLQVSDQYATYIIEERYN